MLPQKSLWMWHVIANGFCVSWNDATRCMFLIWVQNSQQCCLHLCPGTELLLKLKKIVQCDMPWLTLDFTQRHRVAGKSCSMCIVVSMEKIVAENRSMWHKLKTSRVAQMFFWVWFTHHAYSQIKHHLKALYVEITKSYDVVRLNHAVSGKNLFIWF